MKGTWQTTGDGGSGAGVAVVAGVLLAAAVAVPVVQAVAELLRLAVIAAAVLLAVAITAGVVLVTWRLRHKPPAVPPWQPPSLPARQAHALPSPAHTQRPALERPHVVHLHFHGTAAEDIAEALRQLPGGPARK